MNFDNLPGDIKLLIYNINKNKEREEYCLYICEYFYDQVMHELECVSYCEHRESGWEPISPHKKILWSISNHNRELKKERERELTDDY